MPRPDAAFQVGDHLGRYELLREIGKGGFASVWLARLPGPGGFEQRVAIKTIRTDIGTDPAFRNMFLDEARLAAHIHHPNVAGIFELGQEGDVLYLVMEHVQGRPLHILRNIAERRGRKLPVEIIVRILADTCAGLHAAHEVKRDGKHLEVIHRDVSPQNILVSDKGMSKLIDFGVAKANDRLSADTSTGLAKGKVRYMAPEQALVLGIDRRADIWSVGAVAFDLIEGRPPFDGPNDLARIYCLLGTEPAPPFTVHLAPPIERVIRKALAREPDDRWPTAAALRMAFEDALDECRLRVTPDNVAEWFGDSLIPEGDEKDGPNESAYLRERLRRPSTGTNTETQDLAAASPAPRDVPTPSVEHVETLAAVSSAEIVTTRRSRRRWIPITAVAAVALLGGVYFVRAGHGAAAPTEARPSAGISLSAALPVPEPQPDPTSAVTPTVASTLDDEPPSPPPTASTARTQAPTSRPKTIPRARPPKPRPAPSATPRPRYDDTIQ